VLFRSGDDFSSMDCSGFVVEILQAVGILQHTHDYSADALYTIFKPNIVALGYAGCLAFWLDDAGHAVHVMLCIDDLHVIGASGGGVETESRDDAIRQNAFTKMRPIGYRKGPVIFIDPFKRVE